MKFPEVLLRQMPVTTIAWVLFCCLHLPAVAPGRGEKRGKKKKMQARRGLVLKTFSKIKQVLSFGHCCHTMTVSSVLIIHVMLQYNTDIIYTEHYVHHAGAVLGTSLEATVCIYIVHSVECSAPACDK